MKFTNFLNQLKTPENDALITVMESGYQAIFEYPHIMTHDDKYADLYLEKANIKGKKKSLAYVSYLIKSLINNEKINIPDEFLIGDELSSIQNPSTEINYPSVDILINILEQFKDKLQSELNQSI